MSDDAVVLAPRGEPRPRSVLGRLSACAEAIGLVAFAAMMLVTLLQVAARNAAISIPWTEELARILFLAAMSFGIAVAVRRNEHIVVDFLFGRLSPRRQAALALLFDIAVLVLLAVWLEGARRLINLNAGVTYITLPWLPVSLTYATEAAGIVLMMIFIAADLVGQVRRLAAKAPA